MMMTKRGMAELMVAGALTFAVGASAQELDLSTVAGQTAPGATTQMAESKGGDMKEFSAVTDEDIGTLEVGDIYKSNASFFRVTKVSRKAKKGGKFVVVRTSGENAPTRTWTRVSGLGPLTVSSRETLWTLYLAGGGIMHPIAACMVLVIVIAINGLFVFRRKAHCPQAFINNARAAIQKRDMAGFRALCANERGLLGRICSAMTGETENADLTSLGEMQTRAEMEANRQINFLKIPLKALNVVAAVAPMLGLLGTVVGMVTCFESIAFESASASKALVLASGIRVALFTTVAGLTVAIPATIVLFLLSQKLNGIMSDCEIVASRFAHMIAKGEGGDSER